MPKLQKNMKFQIVSFHSLMTMLKRSSSSSDMMTLISHKKIIHYKLFLFGKDDNEYTYTLEVMNFTPYFYIKLPDAGKQHDKATINILKEYVSNNGQNSEIVCL